MSHLIILSFLCNIILFIRTKRNFSYQILYEGIQFMETRKDNGYLKLLNGTVPSREGGEINGSKLPTNKQVPLSLLSNLKSMS